MSSFKITKTVGSAVIEFNETYEDHKELFRKASFITSLPSECGHCKGKELSFIERAAENKTGQAINFYYLVCLSEKCRWEFKYGQHTNQKTLFPKGWEAPYSRDSDPFYDGVRRGPMESDLPPPSFAPASEFPEGEEAPPPSEHKPILNPGREIIGSANEWKNHPSTEQQRKALWAISKQAGYDEASLKEYLWNLYGKRVEDAGGSVSTKTLTKGMISEVIDRLKKDHGIGEGNE